jgi:hypothetical protein
VRVEDAPKVLEDLLGLGREVAGADELAVRIEGELSRDVDPGGLAHLDEDGVGIAADRRRHASWVRPAHSHR